MSITEVNDDLEGNPELLEKFTIYIETFLKSFDTKKMEEFKVKAKEEKMANSVDNIPKRSLIDISQSAEIWTGHKIHGERITQGDMKKASGNFIVENQENKGINLMYDYLGYQNRKDIEFPSDF